MVRVRQDISRWQFVKQGLTRMPAVLACARHFRNGRHLLWQNQADPQAHLVRADA
jgi:hypothetical protein